MKMEFIVIVVDYVVVVAVAVFGSDGCVGGRWQERLYACMWHYKTNRHFFCHFLPPFDKSKNNITIKTTIII